MRIFARLLIAVLSLVMLQSGLTILINPSALLGDLFLIPDGITGLSNLRGLLGGAQITFGILLGLAAVKLQTTILLPAGMYYVAVLIGRIFGFALDGFEEKAMHYTLFILGLIVVWSVAYGLLRKIQTQELST